MVGMLNYEGISSSQLLVVRFSDGYYKYASSVLRTGEVQCSLRELKLDDL